MGRWRLSSKCYLPSLWLYLRSRNHALFNGGSCAVCLSKSSVPGDCDTRTSFCRFAVYIGSLVVFCRASGLKWNFKCVNLRWCRFFVLLLPQFFHNFFTCTVLISFLIKYVNFNLHFAFLFSWLFFVNLIFQSLDTIFGKCRKTEQIKGS